jgi:putative methylase
MKLRHLEMQLEQLRGLSTPDISLEQYVTPAEVAARLLFHALMRGDIAGKRVLDLGCGTGVLACGAALLGASYVCGIDVDSRSTHIAQENAFTLGVEVTFIIDDINSVILEPDFDTVVMNPPFGAQRRYADRPFIDKALECAPVVYGIFNKNSRKFVEKYTEGRAFIDEAISCTFPMKRTYAHHKKEIADINVEIVRLIRVHQ